MSKRGRTFWDFCVEMIAASDGIFIFVLPVILLVIFAGAAEVVKAWRGEPAKVEKAEK